jgi:hypothetical protein
LFGSVWPLFGLEPDMSTPASIELEPVAPVPEVPAPTDPEVEEPVLPLEELPVPRPLLGEVLVDEPVVAELSVGEPVVALPLELTPVLGVVVVALPVVEVPLVSVPVVLGVEPAAAGSLGDATVPVLPLRVSLVPIVPDEPLPVAPVALPVPVPEPAVPVDVPEPVPPVPPTEPEPVPPPVCAMTPLAASAAAARIVPANLPMFIMFLLCCAGWPRRGRL